MNKKIKFEAYFIDLDGTARDDAMIHGKGGHFFGLSEMNKNLIIKHNKKTPIIISTGRDPEFVAQLMPTLKLKYAICQNGSCIINQKGKIVREININRKAAYSLIKFGIDKGLAVKIDNESFYGGGFRVSILARMFGEKRISKFTPEIKDKYNKINLFGKNRKAMKKLLEEIKSMNLPISVVTSVKGFSIEITDLKATKGEAALWVCKQLKIDSQKVAHIGDTMNDTSAFELLGAGIAMDNASDEVKSHADYITSHYRKGGLEQAFQGKLKVNKNKK